MMKPYRSAMRGAALAVLTLLGACSPCLQPDGAACPPTLPSDWTAQDGGGGGGM